MRIPPFLRVPPGYFGLRFAKNRPHVLSTMQSGFHMYLPFYHQLVIISKQQHTSTILPLNKNILDKRCELLVKMDYEITDPNQLVPHLPRLIPIPGENLDLSLLVDQPQVSSLLKTMETAGDCWPDYSSHKTFEHKIEGKIRELNEQIGPKGVKLSAIRTLYAEDDGLVVFGTVKRFSLDPKN